MIFVRISPIPANVLAMSLVSIIPSSLIYLCLQKYFVEGIATSGLKG